MSDYEWAKQAVLDNAYLLYLPGHVIGRATHFYNGVDEFFISPMNKLPVKGAVLELDERHQLLANESNFIRLSPKEAEFFAIAQTTLSKWVGAGAAAAGANKIPPPTFTLLLTSTLKMQLFELEKDLPPQAKPIPTDVM